MIRALIVTCLLSYVGAASAVTEVRRLPPASLRGPIPFAIKITPTTGEDMARAVLVSRVGTPDSSFREPFAPRPDADIPFRGQWSRTIVSERGMAAIAAQLDQAATDDGAPCDSAPPSWPPTWHVRFLGDDLRVAREFDVPVRVVRCRALERSDATVDEELRSNLHTLVELGVDDFHPVDPYPGPPPRLAPEAQRQALLDAPVDAIILSLVGADPNVSMLRLASSPVQPSGRGILDPIQLRTASMHDVMQAVLTHPAFVSGMKRMRSGMRRHPSAEVRVLVRYPGLTQPVLRLISYVSPEDAAAITKQILFVVTETEAEAIRARVDGTDR